MKRLLQGALALAMALAGAPALAQGVSSLGRGSFLDLRVGAGTKTAVVVSGAATLTKSAGVVTTEALTTAAGANYTLTLMNAAVAAADQVFVSVANGTNTAGLPLVARVQPSAGSLVVVVRNADASAAFNGTLKLAFVRLRN